MDLGRKTHVCWAQSSVINIAGEDSKCVQTGDECGHTCLAQARSSCQGVLHTRVPQPPCVRPRDGQTSLFAADTLQKNQVFQSFISSYHRIILILYPRNNSRFETGPLKYFFPLSFEGHSGKTENIPAEILRFWCKRGKPLGCFTAGVVGDVLTGIYQSDFFFFCLSWWRMFPLGTRC